MSLSFLLATQNDYNVASGKDKSLPLKTALFSEKIENPNFPCDSVQTSTTADDSSVSTIGSAVTTDEFSSSRRSVFSKYWAKTGEKPVISSSRRLEDRYSMTSPSLENMSISSSCDCDDDDDDDGLEQHSVSEIAIEDFKQPLAGTPGTPRRSMFSTKTQRSYSLSALPIDSPSRPITRNAVSDAELAKSRAASCLRKKPRFSGKGNSKQDKQRIRRSSSESLVQFDMTSTEVLHFSQPLEVYAEEGWRKHFH